MSLIEMECSLHKSESARLMDEMEDRRENNLCCNVGCPLLEQPIHLAVSDHYCDHCAVYLFCMTCGRQATSENAGANGDQWLACD